MKTFAQTRWNLLAAVTFLAFAPPRLDVSGNSQQSVDQRVDQLTRLISAILHPCDRPARSCVDRRWLWAASLHAGLGRPSSVGPAR